MPQWISDENLDRERVSFALTIAEKVHKGQMRKSGEPYINHPIAVANLIYAIGGNEDMLCAALLHDTIEDAENPAVIGQEIKNALGSHVYNLIRALSKNNKITDAIAKQEAYFQQFSLSVEKDIEVVFIKVADLIDNLKTIDYLKPDKKEKWLRELITGYLPIIAQAFHHMAPSYQKMYHRLCDKLVVLIKI